MEQQPQPNPPLSPQRSFVVQFRADTGAQPAVYDGRIEHVTSGQAALFFSPEELLAFITQVLTAVRTGASPELITRRATRGRRPRGHTE
jgi:hypothetical protein